MPPRPPAPTLPGRRLELTAPRRSAVPYGAAVEPPARPNATAWRIRPPTAGDKPRWSALYRDYAAFYGRPQNEADRDRVWDWIRDPDHEVSCLLVEDPAGPVAGLAHYRTFARPLAASTGCYLDDLFVDPARRGAGAVDAVLRHLRDLARERGWSVVRWITAEDNYRARATYDRHATRTAWVTYDMT